MSSRTASLVLIDSSEIGDGAPARALKSLLKLARISERRGKVADNSRIIVRGLELLLKQREPAFSGFPLRPSLRNFHFRYPIEVSILDKFVAHGILAREAFDKVLLCPECHAVPTVRPGCPNCGSPSLHRDELIHHFSCGHVAQVDHFMQPDGSLRCRKCQKTNLIINADYDVTSGMCRCAECNWVGGYPKLVGRCSVCSLSFLVVEAHQQDLWEYCAK